VPQSKGPAAAMAAQHVSPWLKKRLEPKALKSGRDVQALKDVWKKTEIEQLLGVPCVYIYTCIICIYK
jgi:hypothetical protein